MVSVLKNFTKNVIILKILLYLSRRSSIKLLVGILITSGIKKKVGIMFMILQNSLF